MCEELGITSLSNIVATIGVKIFDNYFSTNTKKRIDLLQEEINKIKQDFALKPALSDEEYNLLISIVNNTICNGSEARIKRFAKIACDVFDNDRIDINRGEKFVYLINQLSEQEVALLVSLYKNLNQNYEQRENDDTRREFIIIPNSEGKYQEFVKTAFKKIGISSSEWFVTLKKFDVLGILQYEDAFLEDGGKYYLSDFGKEFVEYLLE